MDRFAQNPSDFSAECGRQQGPCAVVRENVLFLDDGNELAAVDRLEMKCGYVVIVPDRSAANGALLYHTSCATKAPPFLHSRAGKNLKYVSFQTFPNFGIKCSHAERTISLFARPCELMK